MTQLGSGNSTSFRIVSLFVMQQCACQHKQEQQHSGNKQGGTLS